MLVGKFSLFTPWLITTSNILREYDTFLSSAIPSFVWRVKCILNLSWELPNLSLCKLTRFMIIIISRITYNILRKYDTFLSSVIPSSVKEGHVYFEFKLGIIKVFFQ